MSSHLRLVKSLIPYKEPINEDDALLAIELLSRNLGVKGLDHAVLYFKKMKEIRIEESVGVSMSLMAEKIHKDGDQGWMLLASINGKKKCQLLNSYSVTYVDDDNGISLIDKVKEIGDKTVNGHDDDHGDMCIENVELISIELEGLIGLEVGTLIVDDLDDIIFNIEIKSSDEATSDEAIVKVDPSPLPSFTLTDRISLPEFIEKMKKLPIDCGSLYEDGIMSLCIGDNIYELSKDNINEIEYNFDNLTILVHIYYDEEINLWMVSLVPPPANPEEKESTTLENE